MNTTIMENGFIQKPSVKPTYASIGTYEYIKPIYKSMNTSLFVCIVCNLCSWHNPSYFINVVDDLGRVFKRVYYTKGKDKEFDFNKISELCSSVNDDLVEDIIREYESINMNKNGD